VTMKHKTRTERVYNEATGWYETREVELKGYTFTDDDRILIVREYLVLTKCLTLCARKSSTR